jgi:3-deoxy-D-manno-octulosonate 8-phosphate phosphatase (KDO 8-P phosphatase)
LGPSPVSDLTDVCRGIELLVLDVDGVLTDGGIFLTGDGEIKRFHAHDGLGIKLAMAADIEIAIATARVSAPVTQRARELGINTALQGRIDKVTAVAELAAERGLDHSRVAYIGDDLPDLPAMRSVGLPIAVANARREVREVALHITKVSGGNGAVREAVEWLLEMRGQKDSVMARFLGEATAQ